MLELLSYCSELGSNGTIGDTEWGIPRPAWVMCSDWLQLSRKFDVKTVSTSVPSDIVGANLRFLNFVGT